MVKIAHEQERFGGDDDARPSQCRLFVQTAGSPSDADAARPRAALRFLFDQRRRAVAQRASVESRQRAQIE
jgi:hypothetical protein